MNKHKALLSRIKESFSSILSAYGSIPEALVPKIETSKRVDLYRATLKDLDFPVSVQDALQKDMEKIGKDLKTAIDRSIHRVAPQA